MRNLGKYLGAIAFACAVIFFIGAMVVANRPSSRGSVAATASPSSQPRQTASPTPQPTSTSKIEDEVTPIQDCTALMSADEYKLFIDRIVKYEELRLEPASLEQQKELALLVTKNYQATHSGDKEEPSDGSTIQIIVEADPTKAAQVTSFTCKVVSDSRVIVLVNPYITTVEVDPSGKRTILNSDFAIPAHYSGWVKQGSAWFVDSEK